MRKRYCKFARVFPWYHPLKGMVTFFPEKIVRGEKIHTIRDGEKWSDGDIMVFQYWSGRAYWTSPVDFFENKAISTQKIQIKWSGLDFKIIIDGKNMADEVLLQLAKNDGLTPSQFIDWFTKGKKSGEFSGQILHWTNFKY